MQVNIIKRKKKPHQIQIAGKRKANIAGSQGKTKSKSSLNGCHIIISEYIVKAHTHTPTESFSRRMQRNIAFVRNEQRLEIIKTARAQVLQRVCSNTLRLHYKWGSGALSWMWSNVNGALWATQRARYFFCLANSSVWIRSNVSKRRH